MNKLLRSICLFALPLWLCLSCAEKKSPPAAGGPSVAAQPDTLRFTSGIRAIFQDSRGHYWFGSHGEGVARFDGTSLAYFTAAYGLPDDHILSIQEDGNGTIWFGGMQGVSSYDGKILRTHASAAQPAPPGDWAKSDADLWFAADHREGVYRYDGQNLQYLAFPNTKKSVSGSVYAVTGFSKGKNSLWLSTFAGVFGYDGHDFTLIDDELLGYENGNGLMHVRSILEDSKGRLWIGNNGIGVLLQEGGKVVNFSQQHGKLLPMAEFEANTMGKQFSRNTGLQSVFVIAEDRDGNIWFGDRDTGAWRYDGQQLARFTIDVQRSGPVFWSIYQDKHGQLLFGTATGGVYKFNGESFDRMF